MHDDVTASTWEETVLDYWDNNATTPLICCRAPTTSCAPTLDVLAVPVGEDNPLECGAGRVPC